VTETDEAMRSHMAKMRKHWGRGPWDDEPDREEWRTEAGLPGLIVRGPTGGLCGYVAVPPGHPWHGLDFPDVPDAAHEAAWGGLTYSAACSGEVCHIPAPGEPDDVWWLGFDCCHYDDLTPLFAGPEGVTLHTCEALGMRYKPIGFVRAYVEGLARSVVEAR
jgi:hypothetical protein